MNTRRLVELLSRQRDLYRQLKSLSDQQAGLIERGETEQLLSVLGQRQQIVDELSRLTGELGPYRENWRQLSERLATPDREQVHELIDEVETTLNAIVSQDDRDRQQLAGSREAVGQQVQKVQHAGSAVNAYRAGPQGSGPSRFADQEG